MSISNQCFGGKLRGGGSFATFAYSVSPELGFHLRPMVRKSKSLLLGYISRIFKKNFNLPAGSDPPGFQVPSGGHFKEFSLF